MRIGNAEAKMLHRRGIISWPKPPKRCKHKWGRITWERGKHWRSCVVCKAKRRANSPKAIKRGGPIAFMSPKKRREVSGWADLKRRVFDMTQGICFWTGEFCPFELGTIEHGEPRGDEHETNFNWVKHKPFLGSPHDTKGRAGIRGIIAAMHCAMRRYDENERLAYGNQTGAEIAKDLERYDKSDLTNMRALARLAQIRIKKDIESGAIEARLSKSVDAKTQNL